MENQPKFKILDGLPAYGPEALAFSETGLGSHQEGFVVKFFQDSGDTWVGNFQPGLTSYSRVFPLPKSKLLAVIAGGQGFIIDPSARKSIGAFGGGVEHAEYIPCLDILVLSNGLWFEALSSEGVIWRSRRVSWDGMRNVRIEGNAVFGEGWCFDDTWHQFIINLESGHAEGGAYNGPSP